MTDTRTIALTKGQVAVVDAADFNWLSQWKWCALYIPSTGCFYASRATSRREGKRKTILMHREILGLTHGQKLHGDHINRDTLDNRRSNLRRATNSQNNCNSRLRADNACGFKGVCFNPESGKWFAHITIEHKRRYLGWFSSPELAAAARRKAAEVIHGEFARTA